MAITIQVYDQPNGTLLADWSPRAQNVEFSTNEHGFESLSAFIPMGFADSFSFYDKRGLLHVEINATEGRVWEGRLEDIAITDGGLNITALGYARTYSDFPIINRYSITKYGEFTPVNKDNLGSRTPDRYNFDTNNRIFIGVKKNAVMGYSGADQPNVGSIVLRKPRLSSSQYAVIQFDYQLYGPYGYQAIVYGCNDYGTAGLTDFTAIWTGTCLGGSPTFYTGTVRTPFSPRECIMIDLFLSTGSATNGAEDSEYYLKITNLRVIASPAIATSSTGSFGPGTVNVTPNSMANIETGKYVLLGNTSQNEVVQVLSTTATTFQIGTVYSWGPGTPISSARVYADEIVENVVSAAAYYNSTQTSSNTSLVQCPLIDQTDATYEDVLGGDVLNDLASQGDKDGNQYEWGVYENRQLYFRPKGSAGRQWYVDASSVEVQRSLEALVNSYYAKLQDGNGFTYRTAIATDAASVNQYGVTRLRPIETETTSSTTATQQRDVALAKTKTINPQAAITFRKVYTANGAVYPLYLVRAGDTITIRNLPPTISTAIDKIRTFRISRTTYRPETNELTIEPELPLPTLNSLLVNTAPTRGIDKTIPIIRL